MTKKINSIYFQSIECTEEEIKSFYNCIGQNVKRLRQTKGISQLELSYAIGFKSTSLIAGAEAGYNNIKFSLEHLYKISKALHVDIKEFFDEPKST